MRTLRVIALIAVLTLVAAACGRSGSDKSSGDESSTSTTAAAQIENADFGTLKDVCQKGSPKGSPAQGVTPTEIRVGTFSDPGFSARPGLNQELFDTAEVFSKWCNDNGGINGRKVVVDELDAALTNVKPKMAEACDKDFFLVGGGATFDQDGVKDRLTCMLPDVAGFLVSPEASDADLQAQPLPNTVKHLPDGDFVWLGKKFPASKSKVGILVGDIAATKVTGARQREAITKGLGYKVVYDQVYPAAGPPSWTPYATAIKENGVKGLIWVGEPQYLGKLIQAVADLGYKLDWVRADANHYDSTLITGAGDALASAPVYVRSAFWPFEKANQNPATKKYLELFEKYKPNGKNRTYLGLQAMSAWLLFAQAARECGNDLTRKCVYEKASGVSVWDGGGLHAQTNPSSHDATSCFILEQATPKGFVTPDVGATKSIYRCDPKEVYTLKGDYGKGVKLSDVGRSMSDLK